MINLEELLGDWRCLSKDDVVYTLVEGRAVEELTNMKLELSQKCTGIKDFPKGEFYLRRTPKGTSVYSSLEERLAGDIFELMNCLDTEIITPEIRCMFKPTSTVRAADKGDKGPIAPEPVASGRLSFSSPLIRESGWSGVKSQIISQYLLFREKLQLDMSKLETKVKDLTLVVESQKEEIDLLKEENKQLESQKKEINLLKEESKQIKELCINHGSSSNCCPVGFNQAHQSSECLSTVVNGNKTSNRNGELINNSSNDKSPNVILGEIGEPLNGTGVGGAAEREEDNNMQQNIDDHSSGKPLSSGNNTTSYSYVVLRSPNNVTLASKGNPSNLGTSKLIDLTDNTKNDDVPTDLPLNITVSRGDDGFIGVKRNRIQTKRFFLSGIAENVNKDMILRYLDKKGIKPTLVNLFSSKRKGTLSAKLNVHINDSKIIQEDNFWRF